VVRERDDNRVHREKSMLPRQRMGKKKNRVGRQESAATSVRDSGTLRACRQRVRGAL